MARSQMQFVCRDAQRFRERQAISDHALGRRFDREALSFLVVARKSRTRLHSGNSKAGIDDIQVRDVRRVGKCCVERSVVTGMIVEHDVAGDVIIQQRRAGLCRILGACNRRQRFDIDDDRFAGIAGLRQRFSDDESHRIADKAHLVRHQRQAVGLQ